ncbi:hypothetical protein LCGC14_1330010 [marine sediment metagenome]|uniref:Uncharacterized protein n=1 Tax=marine sediment metagenome TaxID=412755 RepID=A0A0F9KHL2_9ZZZZ
MANMAYCRFQNTLEDLRACSDYLDEADLSEEEKKARKQLINVCQSIVDDAEYLYLDEED